MLHDHLLNMLQFAHALLAPKRTKPDTADLICLTRADPLPLPAGSRTGTKGYGELGDTRLVIGH